MKLSFLDWCRVNWKFLLGVSVPIILILIGKRIDIKEAWDQAKKDKEKEIDIITKSHKTETDMKAEAVAAYQGDVKDALQEHGDAVEKLSETTKEKRDTISGLDAEGATDRLNDRFDLD